MNCIYCNHEFRNKCTLRKHSQKVIPAYCLKIRKENTCKSCKIILHFGERMSDHIQSCDIHKRSTTIKLLELEKKVEEDTLVHQKFIYDHKIKTLETELAESKKQNIILTTQLNSVNLQLDLIRKDHQELALTCAKKETTTSTVINNSRNNTTNNIVNYLETVGPLNLDKDHVKAIVDASYTKSHLLGGQKGLANFVAENITKNEQDQLAYVSSDQSRGTFKYLLCDGSVKTDTKAGDVINVLYDPVMNKIKTVIFDPSIPFDGDYDSENDDYVNYQRLYSKFQQVHHLKINPTDFCKHLSSKTTSHKS